MTDLYYEGTRPWSYVGSENTRNLHSEVVYGARARRAAQLIQYVKEAGEQGITKFELIQRTGYSKNDVYEAALRLPYPVYEDERGTLYYDHEGEDNGPERIPRARKEDRPGTPRRLLLPWARR